MNSYERITSALDRDHKPVILATLCYGIYSGIVFATGNAYINKPSIEFANAVAIISLLVGFVLPIIYEYQSRITGQVSGLLSDLLFSHILIGFAFGVLTSTGAIPFYNYNTTELHGIANTALVFTVAISILYIIWMVWGYRIINNGGATLDE